jgi:hypothetical protein
MDEAQAIEMRDHLLDVDFALQEAIAAVSHLPQGDKEMLTRPLRKLLESLHSKALRLIADQHPQLAPPSDDSPMIICDLRWKEVMLPETVSKEQIDDIIFSKLKSRRLKVARVISDVDKACKEQGIPIEADEISARIRLLADTDRIESFGDVRKWRHSEMCLKDRDFT